MDVQLKMVALCFSSLLLLLPGFGEFENALPGDAPKGFADLKTFFPDAKSIDPSMGEEGYMEYDRGTLYDYINGGAEVYLDLDFVKVGARDYVIDLEEETYITIDVYDMAQPVNAFGIFSAERYGEVPMLDVGVAGTIGGGALNFWTQRYYVKIRADCEGEAIDSLLKKMARFVTSRIGDPGTLPPELGLFPSKNRVKNSERYAARNLLGLRSLKGFSCLYQGEKKKLRLILCPYPTEEEALKAEKLFLKRIQPAPTPAEDGVGFLFNDKYLGRGRNLRVGPFFAIAQDMSEKEKSPKDWESSLTAEFFDRVIESAMKKKTEKGLKQLEGFLKGKSDKK